MNTTDNLMLTMQMLAAQAASVRNATGVKHGDPPAPENGPSFRDLLQDRSQGQPTQGSDGGAQLNTETEDSAVETIQQPEVLQQELAVAIMMQSVTVEPAVPDQTVSAARPIQIAPSALAQQIKGSGPVPQMTQPQMQAAVTDQTLDQTGHEIQSPLVQAKQTDVAQAAGTAEPQAQTTQTLQTNGQRNQTDSESFGGDTRDNGETIQVLQSAQPQEKPIFQNVERAPVKVGDNAVLDTQSPNLDEQLAGKVERALEQGEYKVELQLKPERLGMVTVELTKTADGALQVVIHASNEKSAGILSEHMGGLSGLLQSSTHGTVHVEILRQQESQQNQQRGQYGQQNDGGGQGGRQQEQRQRQNQSQDFLQRLRLGLLPLDA